ncbi:hypothetical protein C8F01DRAFT_1095112 [Mycena amicta]|nr:hypothetical protein C8F01DRAFT_1095112 [Mycena amicta]
MDALSPASCLRKAVQYAKAGYQKLKTQDGAATTLEYGARLIRLGRGIEATVLEAEPTAGAAADALSEEEEPEEDLLDSEDEAKEDDDKGSDTGKGKKTKTGRTSRYIRGKPNPETVAKREAAIRVRVEFVYTHIEGEVPTPAEKVAGWVSFGWAKTGSRGDLEDIALAEAGVGFGSPEDDASWAAPDYAAMMRRSLKLDLVADHVKRDARLQQLIASSAVAGQGAYLQGVVIKMETIKCQPSAHKKKFQHHLGVFEKQHPELFTGMLRDQKEGSVGENGANEESFKEWLATRDKVISARNRLLKTYALMGSAVLIHPFFSAEKLMAPSNQYIKVLEGVLDKDEKTTASALGSTLLSTNSRIGQCCLR